ncbi:MAG: hypothetical protein UU34_C0002G0019 [Candidatus Curtissbacteria bacterium GW2011_GWA1_41_11]|uniref:Uncharacterized protein n=1 Tax=Candidatus Curtissbacteria bacterium GW2011_GWA1_41_11 TaxID=1618409 RepID=A0A0G0XJQ1_9BACT|nr:MAG: hypothetical protein UU34_C0002G0019 [Candidatus Curtissbacteria bacterium GW2011_GWA1_41_11]
MNTNIVPITRARNSLGNLAKKVKGENYIILTKGGSPQAALVDFDYLKKLEGEVKKIYSRTFIDPTLLPLTREFTQNEIDKWQEEDRL